MLTKSNYKSKMILKAIREIDAPEICIHLQVKMILALINKDLTMISIIAILSAIFTHLTTLESPIQTPDLNPIKAPDYSLNDIKAVAYLSFT
ncbi:MAG TPA: hypothetical protein EYN54_09205 [Methylococcaceae bacterium]|nr:hypothetical protein [Methylococcaceae bacterium]